MDKRKLGKFFVLLFIVTAGFLLLQSYGYKVLDPTEIRDYILSFGWWAPVLYIFLYTIRPLLLFPAVILSLTGGLTFGPWWGTLYDLIGASLGSFLAFGLSRKLGREAAQYWMGEKIRGWDERSGENGFKTIFILRLIPLIPFDAVNYGAGLSKISFRDYAAGTILGIIPGAFAYNFLGHSFHNLFSTTFFLAVAFVLCLMLLPTVFRSARNKVSEQIPEE